MSKYVLVDYDELVNVYDDAYPDRDPEVMKEHLIVDKCCNGDGRCYHCGLGHEC